MSESPHHAFIQKMKSRLALTHESPRNISLDELGEAIGLDYAHPAEIDALIENLENEGFRFEDHLGKELLETLRAVLMQARALRQSGKNAGIKDIASALGRSQRAVRVALLYGEVLGSQ